MPDVADVFPAGGWEFTPDVVEAFDGHVRASVPFYDVIQAAVAELSDWLAPSGTEIADLGASTGTTAAAIIERHPDRSYRFHLYDESREMLDAARAKNRAIPEGDSSLLWSHRVVLGVDALAHNYANLTLALFTLQFLGPLVRKTVLEQARRAAAPDGVILVAEKVRVPDARWAEIATEVSWDVKADAGIPAESIRSKARALRGVLRPVRVESVFAELEAAGWVSPTVLFRWHQWVLVGAFATDR
jgi:tRNA (cmo5U34)-methyltransferase